MVLAGAAAAGWGSGGPPEGPPGGPPDPSVRLPLSFTDAEEIKHKNKMKEFKQYLVDTRVAQVLVESAYIHRSSVCRQFETEVFNSSAFLSFFSFPIKAFKLRLLAAKFPHKLPPVADLERKNLLKILKLKIFKISKLKIFAIKIHSFISTGPAASTLTPKLLEKLNKQKVQFLNKLNK